MSSPAANAQNSMLYRILQTMVERQASDVYLSAQAPVTFKIKGLSLPANQQSLSDDAPLQLLAELLTPERIEQLQTSGELNLAISLPGLGHFRLSALRQRGSYAAVIRHVPAHIPPLDTLNLPAILSRLVLDKRGLILIAGASGAGKSTTLAAMLDHRNQHLPGHILTIEDPIEYVFTNRRSIVNQREVGSDTASFHIGLKNGLRQAPDVIMIGEIRDRETVAAALAYAHSGHLCLATLHASNSHQALHRCTNFFPPEVRPSLLSDLAGALRAVVSQRLLRSTEGGQLPAVEVLLSTPLVAELIERGDFLGVKQAMDSTLAEGSQTFEQDLARLVAEGRIDRQEALAQADSSANLLWRLKNERAGAASLDVGHVGTLAPSFSGITLEVPAEPDGGVLPAVVESRRFRGTPY
ncbi:MAG: PilT/PilU family type 4a pilus ATPase [Burkholderiales bacterium]|nr:PilT/PilU family type 4a pilus ATPase [Burkholderiales bacterium]